MLKHSLFVLGVALATFADRLCGRSLAVNEDTLTAPVTVGLPAGLDPEAVLRRKRALIEAGTEPLVAEKFAIDAETQQAARDAQLRIVATTKEVPVTETVTEVHTEPDADKAKKGKK